MLRVYIGVNAKAFHLGLALSSVRVTLEMNKEELVEILARSQEKVSEKVDSKLDDLKRSISADQAECVQSVVRKVKQEQSLKWKKVGNEKQFRFNESVEALFESAIAAIDNNKLDKAKKELQEGKNLIQERQKLNKLAERSDFGWATVSAYLTDDLADTPEDEKRISKAEKTAKKIVEARKAKVRPKLGSSNKPGSSESHNFQSFQSLGSQDDSHFKYFRQPSASFLSRLLFSRILQT